MIQPEKPSRMKLPMTGWYDPVILMATAIRVAISTVFGQFADKREAIAATNAIEPQPFDKTIDYSNETGDFWFDFMADTGDGWNSTYAMARLVSQATLQPSGLNESLPRGRILFLGGDQVYPTASRQAYEDRFLGPFEEAYHPTGASPQWPEGEHDLYAIPGNHDWYDGLNSFFGLFCRRRVKPKGGIGFDRPGRIIAGRKTHQARSYFAVRLPQNWWLWGTDSQLEGYIDQPQIDFFRHVARYWMEPGSKLILCVGQPSWAHVDQNDPEPVFSNFSYLERLAEAEVDDQKKPLGHQLKLVLTGDSHHYARFTESDRHYITCGGGGAFLHPTHQLTDRKFSWKYPPPGATYVRGTRQYLRNFRVARSNGNKEALYPTRRTSRLLTFWNFAFAGINRAFTALLFVAYSIFHWFLDFNAGLSGADSLAAVLRPGNLIDSMLAYWKLVIISPAATILISLALLAYIYAADAANWPRRILKGTIHAVAQALTVTATTSFVIKQLPDLATPWEIIDSSLTAAIASATVYGLYLFGNLMVLGRHWNEGFSSFAHRGYKCMLRMKISDDGKLTIHPIGLNQVPADRGKTLRNPPLSPHLIEDPIIIG